MEVIPTWDGQGVGGAAHDPGLGRHDPLDGAPKVQPSPPTRKLKESNPQVSPWHRFQGGFATMAPTSGERPPDQGGGRLVLGLGSSRFIQQLISPFSNRCSLA